MTLTTMILFKDTPSLLYLHRLFYFATVLCRGTLLVAQLIEALRYKPEGRGIDSRRCHWNVSVT